jgi:signal transduction histidine kinase
MYIGTVPTDTSSNRLRRSFRDLRSDWVEVGGLGRLAVVGVVVALVATVLLGFSITNSVRGHLLDARAAMVAARVEGLPPFPSDGEASVAEYAAFDVAVRVDVLGGETVRVKVWSRNGVIVYSDASDLVGQQFDLPEHAALAFEANEEAHISDLSDPAHAIDRGRGELIEFYAPMQNDDGSVSFVVEVEQDASGLNHALGQIARNVWISIGIGLVSVGLVMSVGIAARTREVNRRRRQAEALLESSFNAQEHERRRIVGSLHDDVGQPMYRVLYGLQGSHAKLDPSDPVAVELDHLTDVVRDMDATLRNELRLLHFELAADAGIEVALSELAELVRTETDLDIEVKIALDSEPAPVHRTEMYRAAREAVTNVRRHASADRVVVSLYRYAGRLVLEVTDDGSGDVTPADHGLGLSTTSRRFVSLDGDVSVERVASGGTRFVAWLPESGERGE